MGLFYNFSSGKKPTGHACGGWMVLPGGVWAIEKGLPPLSAVMAESGREGEEATGRGRFITHQVGSRVPHGTGIQARVEDSLPAELAQGGHPGQGDFREEGVRGRGRPKVAGRSPAWPGAWRPCFGPPLASGRPPWSRSPRHASRGCTPASKPSSSSLFSFHWTACLPFGGTYQAARFR